jgi:hypothetical protein
MGKLPRHEDFASCTLQYTTNTIDVNAKVSHTHSVYLRMLTQMEVVSLWQTVRIEYSRVGPNRIQKRSRSSMERLAVHAHAHASESTRPILYPRCQSYSISTPSCTNRTYSISLFSEALPRATNERALASFTCSCISMSGDTAISSDRTVAKQHYAPSNTRQHSKASSLDRSTLPLRSLLSSPPSSSCSLLLRLAKPPPPLLLCRQRSLHGGTSSCC